MLEIRPAALREFGLLPAIEAEADQALEALDPALSVADLPPPTVEDFAGAFHVIVAGRPPVAFVRLAVVDGQAHLEQLSVSLDHARRGIGRALVMAAKRWAVEAGFHLMTLTTFRDVPFNAPFYASCGFAVVPIQDQGPELKAQRTQEAELGLDLRGPRVAMSAQLISE